jgi:SAM-dependent methyltransferase
MRRIPTPKKILTRLRQYLGASGEVSTGYKRLGNRNPKTLDGWRDSSVASWQHESYKYLLQEARAGRPRLDFIIAARAIDATALDFPLVVEVGCGSGYYSEVLPLLARPIRYVGIDYAFAMTSLARRTYPAIAFVTGDACKLPLADSSCDVLLSGTSLMHIANYAAAIAESVRVAREWCIFHTVPVMEKRSTMLLRKKAYGRPVVEVIFNRLELEKEFTTRGLKISSVFESLAYDVSQVVGERTWTLTYVCRKA